MGKNEGHDSKSSLIFVYNADSGLFNAFKDLVHKNIKPSTYQCNLCALTFDNMGMKKGWKDFIDDLDADIEFLHRDEFSDRFNIEDVDLPAAFVTKRSGLEIFMNSEEIDDCDSLEELKKELKNKLSCL